jgi:uncharacterized protein
MSGRRYSGFLPGRHAIEGYGNFGFTFADMSHRGSILALPSGIYAWDVMGPEDLGIGAFAQVFAEPKGEIEHLLVGTGVELRPLAKDLRAALNAAGIRVEPMTTGAAARTYSILLGEKRRVAAALIAVA